MSTQQITPVKPGKAQAAGIEPFTVFISPYIVEDLRERLGRARWPDEIRDSGWQYGANREYLEELCTHWGHGFDWKEQEDALNAFHHFRATINGFGLHFIHEQGQGANRIPILLLHGWPDSFVRFLKLIPLLTAKGPSGISFDVVVPSMPGFAFSDKPAKPGMNTAVIAELYGGLMRQLGYTNYMVHGSDWGASIAEQLAIAFPEAVIGLHLTEVPWRHLFSVKPAEMTAAEKEYWHTGQQWNLQEGAYGMIQATKPQTLAYALNDSPIGLAAWIIEKFHSWSGADADLEKIYTRDELLMNLTIYWATQSAGSAARIYYETIHHPPTEAKSRIVTPTAVCIAPKDMVPAPRDFAARFFNLRQWTTLSGGGHFLAMEQPEPLAEDILAFALKLNEV